MINNAPPVIPPQQLWQKKYPAIITSILSFVQFGVTVVIIGCEVGSMLIDIVTATIYVGLWASLFFMIAFISQAASSCCCRGRGCATYTLASQCISMFFAICVMGFDTYYIIVPNTCFFSTSICSSSAPVRGLFYSNDNFNNIKMSLIKGQLAAGALMFVLCLAYVIIYIITSIRIHRAKQPRTIYPQAPNVLPAPSTISNGVLTAPPATHYPAQGANYSQPVIGYPEPQFSYPTPMAVNKPQNRATDLVCPTCKTVMTMTAIKQLPM